jgi:hypothetical protein
VERTLHGLRIIDDEEFRRQQSRVAEQRRSRA